MYINLNLLTFCYRRNNDSIFDELNVTDADVIGDVDFGADITGELSNFVTSLRLSPLKSFLAFMVQSSIKGLLLSLGNECDWL